MYLFNIDGVIFCSFGGTKECQSCKGKTFTTENKELEVSLKKGMKNGTKITLEGEGNQCVSYNKKLIKFTIVSH